MDIVYSCRPGNQNFSIVYSLRTVATNVPHDRVFVSGAKPNLLSDKVTRIPVTHVIGDWRTGKWVNATNQLRAVANNPEVSEDFIHFNDDFFVMKQLDEIPTLHRGPIDPVLDFYRLRNSRVYLQSMIATRAALEELGVDNVLSYELHTPMVFNKTKLLEMFDVLDGKKLFYNKRTFYGNYFNIGGTEINDCKISKVTDPWSKNQTFVSTLPVTFRRGTFSRHLQSTFSTPSIYER